MTGNTEVELFGGPQDGKLVVVESEDPRVTIFYPPTSIPSHMASDDPVTAVPTIRHSYRWHGHHRGHRRVFIYEGVE